MLSNKNKYQMPEWVKELMMEYSLEASEWRRRAKNLEVEVKELRQMREDIIKALSKIHGTDFHGNSGAYKWDPIITEIREAIYQEEWEYKAPFERNK